ncbi:uncharacterized protein MONOS_18686 [Monocercomonoides exilis]|uniref:uncharacterized protein n=1 Tax=Monocercomonoides exilis TaxID=2049356 RepID=UPI0035594EDC|nr:hypothetical protein MONOS_18686 [Monocercomonoides exilis]
MSTKEKTEMSNTKQFTELFSELERCNKSEQRKKIGEANEIVDRMDDDEFCSIFEVEIFDKIFQMIEEKKMSMENAILLLKHVGYWNALKRTCVYGFIESSLNEIFEKMIIEESEKKDEKNEKLLADLCECYASLYNDFPPEFSLICLPYLLKIASNKEENEEAQKEVEMALLAISNIEYYAKMQNELYLNRIKEIMKHHQEHHNLTRLAYQSAWQFLIYRFINDKSLEEVITNELHFVGEARRELEELVRNVDLKRREGKTNGKEIKEIATLMRWLATLNVYFKNCRLKNKELVGLFSCIIQVFRASKDNFKEISRNCLFPLISAANNRAVKVDYLLKGDVVDALLEEIQQPTQNYRLTYECMVLSLHISIRLGAENNEKICKAKRKATKRKIFEKMEEDGYEDSMTSLYEMTSYRSFMLRYNQPVKYLSDYFVFP